MLILLKKLGGVSARTNRALAVLALAMLLSGCATVHEPQAGSSRPFRFETDTFAYPNELVWEYRFDPVTGKRTILYAHPPPTYALHCFVVARAARQFFDHARFDSSLPVADEETYRRLTRQVVARSPRKASAEEKRIVVPGYAGLREFSGVWETLLKEECGGPWQSYLQRGHWRMVFPFTRRHQLREANRIADAIETQRPRILHLVRFPGLTMNHAVVAYEVAVETENETHFSVYDPNEARHPTFLIFDKNTRRFYLPENAYFQGGRVDVYEVYDGWFY